MKKLSKVQELLFELMNKGSFNNFDAEEVISDLKEYKELWKSCFMTRVDLLPLRDIEDDCWLVDELYVLLEKKSKIFESFGEKWDADIHRYLTEEEIKEQFGNKDYIVYYYWWD